jgi:hypothetical protein
MADATPGGARNDVGVAFTEYIAANAAHAKPRFGAP